MEKIQIPQDYLNRIQRETDAGIKRGWDAAKSAWRSMALLVLCEMCLTTREFTVNDFRDRIRNSEIKTHDNRAMGGLMTTAKGWGWIRSISQIPSAVGHKTPIQIWRSQIYQEPSRREIVEQGQKPLFDFVSHSAKQIH